MGAPASCAKGLQESEQHTNMVTLVNETRTTIDGLITFGMNNFTFKVSPIDSAISAGIDGRVHFLCTSIAILIL